MKNKIKLPRQSYSLATVMLLGANLAFGQKSESTVQLSYLKKTDGSKIVSVLCASKMMNNKFMHAANAHVNIYVKNGEQETLLGNVVSNMNGRATLTLPQNLPIDKGRFFNITAKIENDNTYEDAEDNIRYKDASVSLKVNAQDTGRIVTAVVSEMIPGGRDSLLKDVPVSFFVQRMFGDMPAGSDNTVSTDENGEAQFAYPKNMPGGQTGVLTIVAKIVDNDTYGNVESKAEAPWGKIVPVDPNPFPRAMWEPRAPWPLITFFVVIFGGIWSIYGYVIYSLAKVNNEKSNTPKKRILG